MSAWETLLLEVWREACRHIELPQAVAAIAAILRQRLPLSALIVREIDAEAGVIETVAASSATALALPPNDAPGGHAAPPESRALLSPPQLEALLAWCHRGDVAGNSTPLAAARAAGQGSPNATADRQLAGGSPEADSEAAAAPAFPAGLNAAALAAPLAPPRQRLGVLVLVAETGATLQPAHRELMRQLIEPFSVVLGNFEQVRELAALREAAEADRQSLLTRLGRREVVDTIVGADSGLRAVMQRVELVARSDVPVLVFGETGSGKEVVARAIHARSRRGGGPFIRVNCGAIPPELIDSQLFGHERGAFTGAVETRKGWFERADGGTLLLDEIGELPPAAQVRLLRILQDGWLERVGGHQAIHVDVRIVAATHRDLAAMVAASRFREDLWYRIAVFPIVLPPLRERRDDIAALGRHFAERAAVRFGLPAVLPDAEAIRLLCAYAWPGNVRELATVIDRAAILGEGRRLEVAKALGVDAGSASRRETAASFAASLPLVLTAEPRAAATQAPAAGAVPFETAPDPMAIAANGPAGAEGEPIVSLDEAMRRHIAAALRATAGRVEGPRGAAALLQINPHTLRARMRKLGVRWQAWRPSRER